MTEKVGTSAEHDDDAHVVDFCPHDAHEDNRIAMPLRDAVKRFQMASSDERGMIRFVAERIHASFEYRQLSLSEVLEATKRYVRDIQKGERPRLFNAYVGDRAPPINDPSTIVPLTHEAIEEMLARSQESESHPAGC